MVSYLDGETGVIKNRHRFGRNNIVEKWLVKVLEMRTFFLWEFTTLHVHKQKTQVIIISVHLWRLIEGKIRKPLNQL